MIEKSIKNGIRIYHKRPRTDKNKSIINTSNKIISAIKIFKSMIDNDEFRILENIMLNQIIILIYLG